MGGCCISKPTGPLGGANCDIWVAQRESVHHEWDWPERLDAVSTEICENSVSLSRDEHHLYFTRPPGDIWVSYRHDVRDPIGWGEPVRLGPTINTDTHSESTARHFASAKHGISQLYFFSNRPGGLGDADIYVADLVGTPPQPVTVLNSPQIDAGRCSRGTDWKSSFIRLGRAWVDGISGPRDATASLSRGLRQRTWRA